MSLASLEQKCNNGGVNDVIEKQVTEYVEKVIERRINKSFDFGAYQIDKNIYEVTNQIKNGIDNLEYHINTAICGCHLTSQWKHTEQHIERLCFMFQIHLNTNNQMNSWLY
uniref:Uncharacterized protein n=1 Tax=Lactuca sativa TaxID=4236 RepID=A0A9R1V495_LACSA|nr:hypothetical protein LSAT_V11C600302080 [Lactuca sativa]